MYSCHALCTSIHACSAAWLWAKHLHGWLQVVDVSDVLFVFSGVRSITHIIASNKGKLQEDQILVAVTKDGGIDEYQASMYSLCRLLICFVCCTLAAYLFAHVSDCFEYVKDVAEA